MDISLENKSDLQLVEVLQRGDVEEIKIACGVLYERYYQQAIGLARHILQQDRAIEPDDVIQEIFLKFFDRLRKENKEEVTNVKAYLLRMVHNLCMNVSKSWQREELLENDSLLSQYIEEGSRQTSEELIEDIVAKDTVQWDEQKLQELLYQLPFAAELSDCQRFVWILRCVYKYPTGVVARLMNKREGTISTHLSGAFDQVQKYLLSKGYSLDIFLQNATQDIKCGVLSNTGVLLERFKKPHPPMLYPEECKPLGIEIEEFQNNYTASFALPGINFGRRLGITRFIELGHLYMLIAERSEWQNWQNKVKLLMKYRKSHDDNFCDKEIWRGHWWEEVLPEGINFSLKDMMLYRQSEDIWWRHAYKFVWRALEVSSPKEMLFSVKIDGENIVLIPCINQLEIFSKQGNTLEAKFPDSSLGLNMRTHSFSRSNVELEGTFGGISPTQIYHRIGILDLRFQTSPDFLLTIAPRLIGKSKIKTADPKKNQPNIEYYTDLLPLQLSKMLR